MRDFGISLPGDPGDDEDPFYKSKDEALRQDVMPSYKPTPAPQFDGYAYLSRGSMFSGGTSVQPTAESPAQGQKLYDGYAYLSRSSFSQAPVPRRKDDSGDTSRGFSAAMDTTPALLKGAVGVVGAVGEQTFGEGGLFSGIKKWGLEGYEKGMQEIQSRSKETDDVTKAWERAKDGDLGALVDWAQYGVGYLAGNVAETAATAVLGGAVGAFASGPAAPAGAVGGAVTGAVSKGVVKGFVESLVTKEAAKLAAGKEVTEEITKQATKNVAKRAGSATAVVGSNIAKETGSIYGEAEEQAREDGRELDAGDLARIFAAGTAAGFTEAAVDLLGLGAVAGKIKLPGGGRAGRAFVGSVAGVGIEGGTEVMQSVIERYGAAKALTGEEAMNEYINAFALGALGGGTIGGLSGALRSGKQDPDTIQKLYEKAQQELTSPDGMAQLYQQMAADPKVGPILEANNITSAEDPRFAQVVARTIKLEQLDAELNMTAEQRKQLRKERAADVKAAFGETASTGVGVGMGTPTDGVIQRASVVPDEQTKTLVPVGEKAEPVTLTSPDGQSTQAVSGEDMIAAQQGFSPLGAFTVPDPTNQRAPFVFANRFGSPVEAADLAANLQALSQMEQQLAAGISNKRKLGKVRSQYNDMLAGVMGFQRVVKWKGWKPFLPDLTGVQIQVRQGKRAASEGGGVFFFLESRPLQAPKPPRATQPSPAPASPPVAPPSASQAPSQPPVTPAPAAPAAPAAPTPAAATAVPNAGTTVPNTGTTEAAPPAKEKPPKKKAEKPAAKKAKETSKKKEAEKKPKAEKPVEPTPPEDKKEPPAAKKAKQTSKKAKAEKEGPALLTPEENEELKALLKKAVAAEEEKQNATQEGKQPEGDQQQRPGNDAGRKERGRKDRERQAQEPEARPEDRGGDSTPEGETVAEQLKRLARERKAALTQEGKSKVDAVEQAFAKMMSWVNRVEEARIEGGGVVDPTDTSRPNLAKATREFVDAVSAIFGDSNVPSVFVAMVRDERDLPSIYTEFEATGKVEGADPNFPARMAYSETTLGIPAAQLKDLERQVAELAEVNKIAKNERAVQIYRDAIQRSVTKKLEKLVGKDSVQAVFDQIRSRVTFLKEATDWVQRSLERTARASLSPAEREQKKSPLDKTDNRLINRAEIAEEWDGRRKLEFGQPTDQDAPTWDRLKREEPVLALRFAQLVLGRQPKSGFEDVLAAYKRNRRAENAKEQLRAGRDEATRREAEVNKAARITKKLKSRDILTKEDKAALGERFGDGYLDSFVDALLQYQTSPSKAPKWLQPALKRALDYLADGNIPAEKADVRDWNKGIPPGALRLFNKRLSDLVQNGASLTSVLQLIARSSPNNRSREMAGFILRNGNPDATVAFLNEEQALIAREAYQRKNGNPNDLAAYYDDTQQAINLLTPDNIEYFVLHEGTHAGTLRAIEMKTPAGLELIELYELYKNQLGDAEDVYGAKNAKEFIAEALSSEPFKRKLESIKSPKYKNLWEHFKAILRRLFRIGETAEQKSLFDRVLELAPRVMQENAALMNPMSFEELTAAALKVEGPFKESDYRKPVVDWAKARFGDRKAPDGTIVWQNFVAWFGDSKAVDGDDQPIVFYHGTSQNIFMFKPKQANAIFVTTDVRFAEDFTDMSEDFMAGKWREYITEADAKKAFAKVRAENNAKNMKEEDFRRAYSAELKLELRNYLPSRANILPLYVRAENPFDYDSPSQVARLADAMFKGGVQRVEGTHPISKTKYSFDRNRFTDLVSRGVWDVIETVEVQAVLRELGHDSFYISESGRKNLGVYDPNAVKSVYNRGQFSSGPMIDAATNQSAAAATGWEINEGGKKDNWLYLFVDKQIDLKRVQQGLAQAGRDIADKWNAYLKEELFHGRSAKRIKDFLEVEVNPVLRMMAANRVDIAELDDYLHARHAKEANEQVARVNSDPKMQDGGSGIKTADAQQYLNAIPAQRRAVLESIAKKVDAMTKGTRELMVEYGLESRDTINRFEAAYKHYVPLFRENVEGGSIGAGQGYSIRGSETRRRLGSTRKVVDVFANIAMQRERVITRGEKNRVGNALYGMVAMNPNREFWQAINPNAEDPKKLEAELIAMGINPADASEIVKQPLRKVIDKRSGMVVNRVNPAFASMPNVLVTRVNGEDRMIIFNAADQRAVRLAGSMKSLDANQLGQALSSMGEAGNLLRNAQSFIGGATRYFAAIQTQYNPAFGLYNFLRDLGGASLNLSSTPLRGMEKQIIAESIAAGMNIWRDLRLLRNGQKAQTMWGKLFEEFDLEGGKTGFRDMFYDPGTKTKNLQTEIEIMRGDKPWPAARAKARFFADALSDFNESIENAIRLATYKAAKEKGLTNEQAASVAKNITVNFNRKGAASNGFSMLYAFFNASVQGSARLAETLRGPAGKKIIQGSIALGIAQAFILAAAGFEDDEPPEFIKDKNLVIPTGDGKYLAIPLPLGFNVLPALSRRMVELLASDNPNYGKAFVGMAQTIVDGFNPLGSATFAQTISPTITDPVIALAENKDFTGKPISREDMNPLDPTPGFTRGKQNATAAATALAELINRLSGGTDATKGALSPTPDQLEYLVGQATGGVGREAMKIIKVGESMAADEELATYNIPVIGRLGGNLAQRAIQTSRFYENVKRMNEHQREYESLVKKGESDGYMEKYPEAQLYSMSDSVYRQISELKRTRKAMAESGEYSKQDLKEIDEVILVRMSEFNLQVKEARARR